MPLLNSLFDEESAITVLDRYDESGRAVVCYGDALEELRKIPSNSIQLIVSSPPYNIGKSYEKKNTLRNYLDNFDEVVKELFRVCHPQGSVAWQVGNYVDNGELFPLDIFFYRIFFTYGFKLRNRVIWHFGHGLHASKRFSGRYETVLWFTKGERYIFNLDAVRVPSKYPGKRYYKGDKVGQPSCNPLGKNPSDFWEFLTNEWEEGIIDIPNVKANHPEKTLHPCQYPVELVERFVLALTNEDDWVLDPYGGAGTSLIAALKNKRRGFVIDKEEEYVRITKERIIALNNGTLKFREIGTPIYKPSGKEKVAQIPDEFKNSCSNGLL